MNIEKKNCPFCKQTITDPKIYEYNQCIKCNSYIYISDKSDESENKEFYDKIYKTNDWLKFSFWKKKIFKYYAKKDESKNNKMTQCRKVSEDYVNAICKKPKILLEVGFGEGRNLVKWLKKGFDAYGIDISENIVNSFCHRFPEYSNRVKIGSSFDTNVDVVYCSALFEHLDYPDSFIKNFNKILNKNGHFIINAVPIVNELKGDFDSSNDISFWKPCHRTIPSHFGIKLLFENNGYSLEHYGVFDTFNNKLLSFHIKNGYEEIIKIRHSCAKNENLPNLLKYFRMCNDVLNMESTAYNGIYIFKKI